MRTNIVTEIQDAIQDASTANSSFAGDSKFQSSSRPHLAYLDGMRGLAALYVVVFHLWQTLMNRGGLSAPLVHDIAWMGFGHSAVAVFIVLSGYCLTIPVAKSQTGELVGGTIGYLKRRALRILPPYFAALGLSLLALLWPVMAAHLYHSSGKIDTSSFSPSVILSHVFLVHNLSSSLAMKINPPMWSVAAEWQIYFFLPLLLLPMYRRAGVLPLLAVACGISLIPHFIFHYGDWTAPWYLGLFAFGMAGAFLNFGPLERVKWRLNIVLCGITTAILWLTYLGLAHLKVQKHADLIGWTFKMSTDFLVGAATISLIVFCTEWLLKPLSQTRPFILRVLTSSLLVRLGAFSYSVYLIHSPVIGLFLFISQNWHPSPVGYFAMIFACVLLVILASAYLFHLAFERPLMRPGK